jgi:uncharacterized phage-associated protein
VSYSPEAVANEFLALARANGCELTNMQLQKLVYIAHGYGLSLENRPFINTPPRAWEYGPVFPSLYNALKQYGSGVVIEDLPAKDQVCGDRFATGVIGGVWEAYGHLDGPKLSVLTHKADSPWDKTFRKGSGRGAVIPEETIKCYYNDLLMGDNEVDGL